MRLLTNLVIYILATAIAVAIGLAGHEWWKEERNKRKEQDKKKQDKKKEESEKHDSADT